MASPLSLPFSILLPFIFQEEKESIDEEDPRPTSSNGACIMPYSHWEVESNCSTYVKVESLFKIKEARKVGTMHACNV